MGTQREKRFVVRRGGGGRSRYVAEHLISQKGFWWMVGRVSGSKSRPRSPEDVFQVEMYRWFHSQLSREQALVGQGRGVQFDLEEPEEGIAHEIRQAEEPSSLVEQQRRKSSELQLQAELLSARRRAEAAERRADELLEQNEKLFAFVRDLSAAKDALQEAIAERDLGRLCMHDVNRGLVLRRLDEEVAVEFRNAAGESIEQVYSRGQFMGGTLPDMGDEIEAHVFAWRRRPKPKDVREFLTAEEIQHGFRGFREAIERRSRE